MKKIISAFLSLAVILAITALCSFSAFAETTARYWEPRPNCQDVTPCVNGVEFGGEIGSEYNRSTDEHLFTYEGEGTVTGWEFPLSEEGKDYEVTAINGSSISIKLVNENKELPYINALVDFDEESSDVNSAAAVEFDTSENAAGVVLGSDADAVAISDEPYYDGVDEKEKTEDEGTSNKKRNIIIGVCIGAAIICAIIPISKKKK